MVPLPPAMHDSTEQEADLVYGEDLVWFSHLTTEYEDRRDWKRLGKKKIVFRDDKPPIKMDWDNCTVSVASGGGGSGGKGKVKLVIRSSTNVNSSYMGHKPVKLRYMLGVDVGSSSISEVRLESGYRLASPRRDLPESVRAISHDRWVFGLGDKAEVWEWTREGIDVRSSRVYRLRESIRKFLESPPGQMPDGDIFKVRLEKEEQGVVPVVYQPAVDSLKNFLREVHCVSRTSPDGAAVNVDVSLVFNDEQLRKFGFLDSIYRWFRRWRYGRTIDIESFAIHWVSDRRDQNHFAFKDIYSKDFGLVYDTVHFQDLNHRIKHYFASYNHPVVFINTSNHAMAGHDNNHDLWKWEYIPWADRAPVKLGTKSRAELEKEFA